MAEQSAPPLLARAEVLSRFPDRDPIKADLVKLRYFAGLTLEQAAQALGISRATAERYWAYARAWLYAQLTDSAQDDPKN